LTELARCKYKHKGSNTVANSEREEKFYNAKTRRASRGSKEDALAAVYRRV
jgi:hypothetical protein